ncbi:unnamed protein product [Paramecium primaurelia]|uniref:F5/8 type C domain-containing protein n=1 Tax=Paramecium primaurelia TaxID=5886 RepID=A0A8S1PYG8_PARPR|nr:unnamed protein product [Paramecium primaurelia]
MQFVIVIILELIVIGGCCQPQDKIKKSIIRGSYTNVLHLNNGALISSRKMNYYPEGQIQSLCLRDSIYNVNWQKGYWGCNQGNSIIIDLFQTYELNTLKLRVWDLEFARWYNLEVYIIYNNIKKLIFTTTHTQGLSQNVIKKVDQFLNDPLKYHIYFTQQQYAIQINRIGMSIFISKQLLYENTMIINFIYDFQKFPLKQSQSNLHHHILVETNHIIIINNSI